MNEKEKRLVEMVLAGNLEAFEPLVTPYRKTLLNMAYRMTQNCEDAKEIAQETFLRAFKYLKRFDPERSFKNWILQILVNEARNFMGKRERNEQIYENSVAIEDFSVEQHHLQKGLKSQLRESLEGLSQREREVFLLRDIEECSIKETAKILSCSSISVRVHLSSARKKIKETMRNKFHQFLEEKQ